MNCPKCGNPTVYVLRADADDIKPEIRRRRACRTCKVKFWTTEQLEGHCQRSTDIKNILDRLLSELPVALSKHINAIFSDSMKNS